MNELDISPRYQHIAGNGTAVSRLPNEPQILEPDLKRNDQQKLRTLWYEQFYSLSFYQAWPCPTGQSKHSDLGRVDTNSSYILHLWKRARSPIAERTKLLTLPAKEDP